uniref:BRCT domain-containing protein n=1 Tax=Heterorhabditis bacteriophora TaxID=37862 RepID=A0A1I7X5T4_HETBA
MIVEVYDPKKRNEIIQNYLQNRKEHKVKNLQERSDLEEVEEHRVDIFKPILESNKKLQEEIIDEKNKIVQTLNSFKDSRSLNPQIMNSQSQTPIKQLPSNSPMYLQDPRDKSNAGYSIRFDNNTKGYTIGNKDVEFDDNTIQINSVVYTATEGLMELLTKKSPNFKKIQNDDTQNYREILLCSNALYQGFDKNSKRYNADASDKWKFIKANYFVAKPQGQSSQQSQQSQNSQSSASSTLSQGSSISFIPSNPNSLIDSLRLSIGSYQAGNTNEYNKIHVILDELVRQKKIKKKDLGVIYLNIGL